MTDNSKFWRELDPSTQNYCLEKDIEKAEKKMKEAKERQEENLEELFDRENWNRLKAMHPKDMTWQDIELRNEIKKKYEITNKSYDGSALSDVPQAEGAFPDTTAVRTAIINSTNELVPMIQSRGVSVQPIPEGASLSNVLSVLHALRDALKNSQSPVSGMEDPEEQVEKKWKREELLATKAEIEKMLKKGQYL